MERGLHVHPLPSFGEKTAFMPSSAAITLPAPFEPQTLTDANAAVARLIEIYQRNTRFLAAQFQQFQQDPASAHRVRACYPKIVVETELYGSIDSRRSYGFLPGPGTYSTTISRPDIFADYLTDQIALLITNHAVPVTIQESDTPIPIHFAFLDDSENQAKASGEVAFSMRDVFDVPQLEAMDDSIVNGTLLTPSDKMQPLAPFTAPRVDYSLQRLKHYTATSIDHFQNFVLFTNYQFYIDAFKTRCREMMARGGDGYDAFVEPGNVVTTPSGEIGSPPPRLPQMPSYHLKKSDRSGITLINIGVGPSNAKTITDHVAVLRPDAWLMLGHCAGLRNTQRLGDYVLAHGYVREDKVLDADLPTWVPIPALAEVQTALEEAVAEITGRSDWDLKQIMRTGTVASIDNRNWELRDHSEPAQRLSQSRAIALDMESATIAANGFRFRVPYGTLLCVSDKPLHGELKLPGMASDFYRTQVDQHLEIGIRALEKLAALPAERLHSRKLRSFSETAFL